MQGESNNLPIYTAYTDEEIEQIKTANQEIGRLKERKRMLEEELFQLKMQQVYCNLQRM